MQRNVPIEIDPVTLTTTDGKERKFLLSAGGMNRIKTKFSVKTLKALFEVDESASTAILWEALLDKGELTEEAFNDILPFNPAHIAKAVGMLLGASFPDPQIAAPKTAAAMTQVN